MKQKNIIWLFSATAVLLGLSYFLSFRSPMLTEKNLKESLDKKTVSQSAKPCSNKITPNLTEGPYYKTGSPQRNNITEEKTTGAKMILTGVVYDQYCNPISNAWLDFWQADTEGEYDNQGFKLRGHQFTNNKGEYTLETVLPGEYPGRIAHIHVKLRAGAGNKIHTSQLYFPNNLQNRSDSIFDKRLVVKLNETGNQALYNFYLDAE